MIALPGLPWRRKVQPEVAHPELLLHPQGLPRDPVIVGDGEVAEDVARPGDRVEEGMDEAGDDHEATVDEPPRDEGLGGQDAGDQGYDRSR